MFILDGKPLSPDVAFTHDGIQYPANWLRLASPEERAAIGITEQPDPAPVDQRFWWDTGIPKDHAQLVEQWVAQTRTTAGTLLAPTDWMVIRQADNGTEMPLDWKLWRELVRIRTGEKIAAINATTTTEELAAYISGADYPVWPADPSHPIPAPAADSTISFQCGVTSARS
jgi:hypothetical protein